jgi:hypothetical protein
MIYTIRIAVQVRMTHCGWVVTASIAVAFVLQDKKMWTDLYMTSQRRQSRFQGFELF